jgi:hypothetical protein
VDEREQTALFDHDPRNVLARTRDDTMAKLLGPEWVEVEPGIFLPPGETQSVG